jgi:hypothetical protein
MASMFDAPRAPEVQDREPELSVEAAAPLILQGYRVAGLAFQFLRDSHLEFDAEHSLDVMLDMMRLGAALWTFQWELAGLHVHTAAGLPGARAALLNAVESLADLSGDKQGEEALERVLALFLERFAWSGQLLLNADVSLDLIEDDAALDAVAELLWRHRKR